MINIESDSVASWSEIVPSFAKLPLAAYNHRHLIQKWWKKMLVAAGKGNTNIIIVGRPAVGKSVLSARLHGEAGNLDWKLPDTSNDIERKAIQLGEWTKIVTATPGHTSEERDKAFHEAFSKHQDLEGVLYVTNWGYTSVRDNTIREKLIKEDGIDNIQKLREYNLNNELKDFEQVCIRIREAHACGRGPSWLAIAVNKADLFFQEIDEVQKYYHPSSNSSFTKSIHKMLDYIGKNNIKCISLPVCSYEEDFTWNKESKKHNIGGTENKRALLRYFINEISKLEQ